MMKKKLAILNSDSKEFSYGGISPIMRNMHKNLSDEFDVKYFYLSDKLKKIPGTNRFKILIYLYFNRKKLNKFDFILSHIDEGSYVASFLVVPFAHIYHGNFNPMTQSRYWFGKYFKWVFNIFRKRIEKKASIKYTVGPVWGDKKKLYNPVSQHVAIKPEEKRSGFIFAGRLELIKNIDRLIQIYSKLPKSIQDLHHFYIAGYGTQEKNLKNMVERLNIDDKVHFLGNLSNDQLIEVDSSKKILIMASTQEGLPTAIAEALSVGVPVITTNPGDIGIVIKNEYNGYIFPLDFKDDEYIDAIIRVLEKYNDFSRNAQESSKIFNSEIVTKNVIKDINQVIK